MHSMIHKVVFSLFQKMAKWSSQHNGKYPDPYSKLKLDEEKKIKKKKKKKDKNRDRDNLILSQIDPNTNKVFNHILLHGGYRI
jgi:hypothetical protein